MEHINSNLGIPAAYNCYIDFIFGIIILFNYIETSAFNTSIGITMVYNKVCIFIEAGTNMT